MDAASNHYIQAGVYLKAITAAVEAKQWNKAVQILNQLETRDAKPFFKRIAQHFVEVKEYKEAEKYFQSAGYTSEAVAMWNAAGHWKRGHELATTCMAPEAVAKLYVSQAASMEAAGKWKEAEQLYVTVQEPDLAINMYKKARLWDDVRRPSVWLCNR
jgi:intraflagellar transport protein 172